MIKCDNIKCSHHDGDGYCLTDNEVCPYGYNVDEEIKIIFLCGTCKNNISNCGYINFNEKNCPGFILQK